MRRPHYLRRNENNETIHHAIFVDTETRPDAMQPGIIGHRLKLGWAAYVRRSPRGKWLSPDWCRFTDAPTFWSWVETRHKPRTRLYVFCHNTAFDLPVLGMFSRLPLEGWQVKQLVIDAPPTIIKLRRDTKTLLFLDTLNWWRMPLAELGRSLGLPKLTMPADDADPAEWDAYNKRDVEIIMRAVCTWADFLIGQDFGGFATTLAAQSLRTYRHKFMRYPILVDSHAKALECSRACYHGGRTEPFWIGRRVGSFDLLDINAMYPHVMAANDYPTRLLSYRGHISPGELRPLLRRHCVCARVRVRVDQPALPVIRDNKLVFPVGEFDCGLSTPELEWVVANGELVEVYDAAIYLAAPIFQDFVHELYQLRLAARAEGNDVQAWLFKILTNSLYGKFGQRGLTWEIDQVTGDPTPKVWTHVDAATGQATDYRQVLGVIQRRDTLPESKESHPAIAAHVTAYGRMMLWQLITKAGRRHVYYSDTDSLLVDRTGLRRLAPDIDPDRLGHLKVEGNFRDIEIHGPKDYCFDDRCKIKGVKRGALWLGPADVEQEQWTGLKGLLRSNSLNLPTTATIRKHLRRNYDKGVIRADGWVEPFELP